MNNNKVFNYHECQEVSSTDLSDSSVFCTTASKTHSSKFFSRHFNHFDPKTPKADVNSGEARQDNSCLKCLKTLF